MGIFKNFEFLSLWISLTISFSQSPWKTSFSSLSILVTGLKWKKSPWERDWQDSLNKHETSLPSIFLRKAMANQSLRQNYVILQLLDKSSTSRAWASCRGEVFLWFKLHRTVSIMYNGLQARGFPVGAVVKNPPANAGESGSISGSGRSPGEGNLYPFQCSSQGNPVDRGAWQVTVHWAAESQTCTFSHWCNC